MSFVLRNTPPQSMDLRHRHLCAELGSLSECLGVVGRLVSGRLSWAWIFWQNVPLALGMVLCSRFGVRPDPVR
jgi:MFS transporter, DHA2 family, multidrug resistance protein